MLPSLDHLSLIFRTHLAEGENQLLLVVLQPPHVCCSTCVYIDTDIYVNIKHDIFLKEEWTEFVLHTGSIFRGKGGCVGRYVGTAGIAEVLVARTGLLALESSCQR